MFKSILVGIDGSEHSIHAQNLAFYLARQLHASILGLHVVDILSLQRPLFNDIAAPGELEPYLDPPRDLKATLTARGQKLLRDFVTAATREGLRVNTALACGVVADQICQRSKSVDLIILGHRAANQPAPASNLSGTAQSVARKALSPVLICPTATLALKRVALAYDGSERACKAMHAAAELASQLDAQLTVLSISRDLDTTQRLLAEAQAYFASYEIKAEFTSLSGYVPEQIVKFICDQAVDVLFIGAYGHSRLVTVMLGSTTQYVLRNAPCSLFLSH